MSGFVRALPAILGFLAGRSAGIGAQQAADRAATDRAVDAERQAAAQPTTPDDIMRDQETGKW